jgi:hypothetical protein
VKKPFTKKIAPVQKDAPKFLYVSVCCGEQATKAPCVAVDKKAALEQGLGKFRCPKCRKACKCGRSKNVLDKA